MEQNDVASLKGHCFCHAITYKLTKSPIAVDVCHCRDCQSLSGSAFSLNIIIESDQVIVTSSIQPATRKLPLSGEDRDTNADANAGAADPSSTDSGAAGAYCPECNTLLWRTSVMFGDRILFVQIGTLTQNQRLVPEAHFFTRSKHPWVTIPAGVKAYETLPEDMSCFPEAAGLRLQQAMS